MEKSWKIHSTTSLFNYLINSLQRFINLFVLSLKLFIFRYDLIAASFGHFKVIIKSFYCWHSQLSSVQNDRKDWAPSQNVLISLSMHLCEEIKINWRRNCELHIICSKVYRNYVKLLVCHENCRFALIDYERKVMNGNAEQNFMHIRK